jgi:hypothetical protein
MANIELSHATLSATAPVTIPSEWPGDVRLAIHDASRLEWSLSLPLPDDAPAAYTLRVELQIAQNAFVRHMPWDQLQAFARLDGPAFAPATDAVTIDALRRGALAMANELARASDGFKRHCRLAASLFVAAPQGELEDALGPWIASAVRIAKNARQRLTQAARGDAAELTRERALVDEYVSVRLLEMLAGAERALSNLAQSRAPHASEVASVIADVESRVASALADELRYREEHGFTNADPSSPHSLERYLDRSSRLKKHFQEVLFLEQETYQVAERAYHWVAAFVAVLASTWAFVWQIAVLRHVNAATTVGSGVFMLAFVVGLVYAGKDRIKEVGRSWMTRRLQRVWGAQRVSRYRAPLRRLPERDVVVTARESFDQRVGRVPDPLNPECGASTPIMILSYEHRGEVHPNDRLVRSGVRRVKHVFRYDLSPLFARLDDATKPVPVLDDGNRRVRFIDAPRCYRIPMLVEIESEGQKHAERSTLVLHKRGLERIEREREATSSPEVGIEPG